MTAPKPRRRTIRFAIVAVVCLLLGAVTTVGVAWSVALLPTRSPIDGEMGADVSQAGWPVSVPAGWQAPTDRFHSESWASDWQWVSQVDGPRGDVAVATHSVTVLRFGWPLRALQSQDGVDGKPAAAESRSGAWSLTSWRRGWELAGAVRPWEAQRVPLLPLFPGFALDTALYAAAWYLLLFTPLPLYRAGRRRFRVSRGMCASCGYDLNASTNRPCPECGAGAGAKA